MDDFFHDIESVKSSRFSISKPDAPTGLYLEEYDQYLTNDQELIIITGNTIVIWFIKYIRESKKSSTNGLTG